MVASLRSTGGELFSMQMSKPGQARVFGVNGHEYTAGTVLRMKAQWRLATQACSLHEPELAARRIEDIRNTLKGSAL